MNNQFILPKAPEFSKYLEDKLGRELTSDGFERIEGRHESIVAERKRVKLNGSEIGQFYSFYSNSRADYHGCAYVGRIPGYVNGAVREAGPKTNLPVDHVQLEYTDYDGLASLFTGEDAKLDANLVMTGFCRRDKHTKIPFP